MKKHFMYVAAAAIALMTSCTNEEVLEDIVTPENPNEVVDDGTTRMAIELGVADAAYSVVTRGTGAAGTTTDQTSGLALWDKQELKILMTQKTSLMPATELDKNGNEVYIFDGLKFNAPESTATTLENMLITNTAGAVKYYPMQKAYNFYGFHFDDAAITSINGTQATEFAYPEITDETTTAITYGLTIDGTQDLMIAKAELTTDQKTILDQEVTSTLTQDDVYARAYSSWAARRNVQPIMNFNHLLARLDFQAKQGIDIDMDNDQQADGEITISDPNYTTTYTAAEGYPQPNVEDKIPNGVYVKSIKLLNPVKDIVVTVANTAENGTTGITEQTAATEDNSTYFELMRKPTQEEITNNNSKDMLSLIPVTPGTSKYSAGNPATGIVKVGDGMMIVPGEDSFEMEITLMQYVMTNDGTGTEVDSPANAVYEWKEAKMNTTVKLENATEGSQNTDTFEAGKFYTINVTIYGFQKIEVTATLSEWEEGGSIESNPEDDAFNQ